MSQQVIEPGTEWTSEPVPCGFCGEPDEGYAKKDKNGKWRPSCWACVKPKNLPAHPRMRLNSIEEPPPEERKEKDDKQSRATKRKAKSSGRLV
jgi:hypothetical protein